MNEKYIFGQGDVPEWVSGRLYHYRRPDGKTGYEIDTGKHMKVIFPGDKLINCGNHIKVERSGTYDEETKAVDGERG